MTAQREGSTAVTFEDIIIYFSPCEWRLLNKDQKQLYWETLHENYHSLLFVGGCPITSAEVYAWVENNERLNTRISSTLTEDPPSEILSIADEEQYQMDIENVPEPVGPLKSICKEEDTNCNDVEGHSEQSCVSAAEQGSVPNSGGQLQTESMEWASGDIRTQVVPLPCYVWVELLPIPAPVLVPEKSVEMQSLRTTILPQHDFAMGTEHPVGEMRFADATCNQKGADLCLQAVAPAVAQSPRKMQDTPPSPLEDPTEKKKLYYCPWCQEPFKLQINLEVHYRYCRQKEKQQPMPFLKPQKTHSGQNMRELRSTGHSADSVVFPQKSDQCPSSDDGKGIFWHFGLCQPQQRQRVVKSKDISDASKGTAESPHTFTATTCAMKKLYRCQECGEKFVYKWQLLAHLRGCRKDMDGKKHLPPKPQDLATKGLPNSAGMQEASIAPAVRPSTSKEKTLYPCDKCGKNLSKCYISTHRAFHEGERYKCLWCGKVFNFRSAAVRHKKQHYKKGIICPKCRTQTGDKDCFCMIQKIIVAPDLVGGEQVGMEEPK